MKIEFTKEYESIPVGGIMDAPDWHCKTFIDLGVAQEYKEPIEEVKEDEDSTSGNESPDSNASGSEGVVKNEGVRLRGQSNRRNDKRG